MKFLSNKTIGLSLFRVLVGFFLIKKAIFLLPMASELYGIKAIAPYQLYLQSLAVYNIEFLRYPFYGFFSAELLLIAMVLTASLYIFGISRGFAGMVLLYMITILRLRNGFILDGSDNVIQVTLPFLIIADSYKHFTSSFRLPALKGLNKIGDFFRRQSVLEIRSFIAQLALFALMVQVCFVYFFTAIAKFQGELWLNGTAIYYTMRVEEFRATDWNIPLTENHYFVVLGTYFTIIMELAFIFMVWSRSTKYYVLATGVLLHVGIWIFMRIDDFSWVMLSTYLLFIDNDEFETIFAYLNKKWERLVSKIGRLSNLIITR